MKSTSNTTRQKQREPGNFGNWFRKVLGGEFLLGENMRPVYIYFVFIVILIAVLIVSEQRVKEKNREIIRLENEYKKEISRLKSNNQFIPYEQNKILIQTMKDRGYVFDEKHVYTVPVHKPVEEKKHFWQRKTVSDEKK